MRAVCQGGLGKGGYKGPASSSEQYAQGVKCKHILGNSHQRSETEYREGRVAKCLLKNEYDNRKETRSLYT